MAKQPAKSPIRKAVKSVPEPARKPVALIVGGVVLLAGLAMLLLPGPAFIFIPLGLAILATEFPWARLMLRKIREKFAKFRKK